MKKLFKNILMQFVFASSVFCFVGCQEYNIDSQPEKPANVQIDGQESYTLLASPEDDIVFGISANTPWTISSDQQWCKVTPASSATTMLIADITISVDPNETRYERTAKVTIKAEEIIPDKVITIIQKSKENLVVVPSTDPVSMNGGEYKFKIYSNKDWEIIPSVDWLSNISEMSGNGDESGKLKTITVTVPENLMSERQGQLLVKTAFDEYVITVVQNGLVVSIDVAGLAEDNSYSFASSEESSHNFSVTASHDWDIIPGYAEWLSPEKLSGEELKLSVKQNNCLADRTADITLNTVASLGFEGKTFTVKQPASNMFTLSSEGIEKDNKTGMVKVTKKGINAIVSNFSLKKGSVVIDFADIMIKEVSGSEGENDGFNFNFWPSAGNTNFKLNLHAGRASTFTCGGNGYSWEQKAFTLSEEEIKAIRKIEFVVEDDPKNVGKLRLRCLINDEEKANLMNKVDVYASGSGIDCPGQNMNIKIFPSGSDNYYTVKSITHFPEE